MELYTVHMLAGGSAQTVQYHNGIEQLCTLYKIFNTCIIFYNHVHSNSQNHIDDLKMRNILLIKKGVHF